MPDSADFDVCGAVHLGSNGYARDKKEIERRKRNGGAS
jgi:hypothetical protein